MVNNIVNKLNSINGYSKKIIIIASIVSLALCLSGAGIIAYNSFNGSTMAMRTLGSTMIYSAIVLFAQFVIGSLVIDFINALIHNNE